MINIYCQYSRNGYKNYFLQGKPAEEVSVVVVNGNYGFPSDAHCYFSNSGAKIIYRYLKDGRLDLVIRNIPTGSTDIKEHSIHSRDEENRLIPCCVQFIGDPADRNTLDHMAVSIANDLTAFEKFFANLFYAQGANLYIHGDKLRAYIEGHSTPFSYKTDIKELRNIRSIKDGVILFVPTSRLFGTNDDRRNTERVCETLCLNFKELQSKNCVITYDELMKIQKTIQIIESPNTKPPLNRTAVDSTGTTRSRRSKKLYFAGTIIVICFIFGVLVFKSCVSHHSEGKEKTETNASVPE